jgi:hypothetical protein
MISKLARPWLAWVLCLVSASAQAHLMVAQKGTLHLQGDGAYMVVSLPVSAFQGIDDDGDGAWSSQELGLHSAQIHGQLAQQLRLRDAQGDRPIEGVMLIPTPPDDKPGDPVTQLVVMARFALAHPVALDAPHPEKGLVFHAGLFGQQAAEKQLSITVTQGGHKQLLMLSPERPELALFPSGWQVMMAYLQLGVLHIWMGWDHLLFLAVVLLAGGTWRQVLYLLSAFTVGHAVTLAWGLMGQIPFSMKGVEASIAATIVVMAAMDARWLRHQKTVPLRWRLLCVFACALLHGLGLASSLLALGLDPAHRLGSLLGFNLGVELGQCWVALVCAGVRRLLVKHWPPENQARCKQLCLFVAMMVGTFWTIERLL